MTNIIMDEETIIEIGQDRVASQSQCGIIYVTFLAFQHQAGIIIDIMDAAALIMGEEMIMATITGEEMITTIINPFTRPFDNGRRDRYGYQYSSSGHGRYDDE